jgi:hypothetical protein
MDDSQANNDNRAGRSENRTQEFVERKKAEYDELKRLLKERVEEMNANRGNLPEFVVRGSLIIQLGHIELHLEFDQLYSNPTDYVLVLKVGVPDNKKPTFGSAPPPVKHKLQPALSDDLSSIEWVDKVGSLLRFTSAGLVEFALDLLTSYYRQHTPN